MVRTRSVAHRKSGQQSINGHTLKGFWWVCCFHFVHHLLAELYICYGNTGTCGITDSFPFGTILQIHTLEAWLLFLMDEVCFSMHLLVHLSTSPNISISWYFGYRAPNPTMFVLIFCWKIIKGITLLCNLYFTRPSLILSVPLIYGTNCLSEK